MAITKVGAMTDPPGDGDYAILQAKLDAYAKQIGNQGMILTQWTNTIAVPKIAMGSYITHGGTLFVVDTEDFAVSAPAGDGTYYLKVAASGDTLAVSWVASLSGYTWNAIYNGLYHSDESQILPYQLVKAGATLTKRKITNLMQGAGFVTVDWTGATNYVDQGVKTTDSPTFVNVHATVNDAEFFAGGAKKDLGIAEQTIASSAWYPLITAFIPSGSTDAIVAGGYFEFDGSRLIISSIYRYDANSVIAVGTNRVVGSNNYLILSDSDSTTFKGKVVI